MARALLVAVMMVAACSASHAVEPYSARVEVCNDPGTLSWTYTAFNTSQESAYYIYQLLVGVDFDTFVTNAEGPAGWQPYYEIDYPDHFVSWTCSDPEHYIMSGAELGGFRVYFDRPPATQMYSADFGSLLDEDERRNETGDVNLLEPGTLTGAAFGLVALGVLIRRRST
jgi:hypothetical protein